VVLVSFVLVVVAAITLVIGLLQSGLGIIYVSIACSVLAGVVLFIAVLRGRPEPRAAGAPAAPARSAAGPAPAPESWQGGTAPTPAVTSAPPPPPPPPPPPEPSREPVTAGVGARRGAQGADGGDRTEVLEQVEVDEAVVPADGFPIHDYDRLRATEILPMLAELSDDQLEAVEERERAGKNRFMILSRIEDEKQSRQGDEAWDADDESWDDVPDEVVGETDEADVLVAAPAATDATPFPIPDYDGLRALEVLGRLPDLEVAELRVVRRREEQGSRRAMVLNRIDRLIEEAPSESEALVVPPPPPATGSRRRAVKAPAAKKTGAAKTAAKKAAVAKATAKKAGAAKATAKKAGAAKAPAEKAAADLPATKAPATRAPAAKRASAVRKTAAAEPAPKKAAPAKRAAVAKRAVVAPPRKAPTRKSAAPAGKVAPPVKVAPAKRVTKRR
jgi:hypothetical protein